MMLNFRKNTTKQSFSLLLGIIFVLGAASCVSRSIPPTLFEYPFFSQLQKNNIKQMAAETLLISYRKYFRDWEGRSILMLAILAQEHELIPKLIENNIDVDMQDSYGNTALIYAVSVAKEEIVGQLLEVGADINLQNNDGMSALMFATFYNTNDKIITLLLEYRPDTPLENSDGQTAWDILQENIYIQSSPLSSLLAATKQQNIIEIIKLPKMQDLNRIQYAGESTSMTYKNNTTAIMWAAKYNPSPAHVLSELASTSDINAIDDNNNNALHYALANIHSDKAKISAFNEIEKRGVDANVINNNNKSPFIIALENNAPRTIIKSLIDTHRVLDVETVRNQALFIFAEYNTSKDIVRDIVRQNVDINHVNADGRSAIYYLAKGVNTNNVAMYKAFKRYSAKVDIRDNNGNIPLHEIVKDIEKPSIVSVLLRSRNEDALSLTLQANIHGQNVLHVAARYNNNLKVIKRIVRSSKQLVIRTRDVEGKLPINYAAEFNENTKIIKYLIRKYPESVSIVDKQKRTLLMSAAKNKVAPNALSKIISHFSPRALTLAINQQDVEGNTALHYAARYSKFPVVIEVLLDKGAELDIQNNLGQTPLMVSMLNTETPDIADALLKKGADINALDKDGVGVLLFAAKNSIFIEHIRALFAARVNTAFYDRDGKDIDTLLFENKYLAPFIEVNEKTQ